MFADACETALKFTRPVVAVWHCIDGQCRTAVGTFVVVNDQGWILSAGHIGHTFQQIIAAIESSKNHEAQLAAIQANNKLTRHQRKQALRELGTLEGYAPLDWAVWWGADGVAAVDVSFLDEADLMLARLEPYDPAWISEYPVFRDGSKPLRQGTSLCRVGYPFDNVKMSYDSATRAFAFDQLEVPVFAIEGIYTRQVLIGQNAAGYRNMFLETSSPGLKGQSGGPILDTSGLVWAIQSRTVNLSLGFDPEVPAEDGKKKGGKRKEHQFLNVGWGTHPETVVGFLKEKGIAHATGA